MSGWLAKASGALRGDGPEPPPPFEVDCECGTRHQGLRRTRPQRLICRECGAALFVLPKDAYPPPATPKPPKPKKKKKRPQGAAPQAAPRKGKRSKRVEEPTPPPWPHAVILAVGAAAAATGRGMAALARGMTYGLWSLGAAFLGWWTPIRLIVLAIVCVLSGTIVWTWHSHRVGRAQEELKAASDAAWQSLEQGEIAAARDQFEIAVGAVNFLKRRDLPAARLQQQFRETTAMSRLAPHSLLEMLAEAERVSERGGSGAWQAQFEKDYRGRWVVMEAPVARPAVDAGCVVLFPIVVGDEGRSVELDADLAAFDSVVRNAAEQPVVFAAQLAACTFEGSRNAWRVEFDAQSGFLWCNLDNYRRLGFTFEEWHPEEEVAAVLDAQSSAVGVEW